MTNIALLFFAIFLSICMSEGVLRLLANHTNIIDTSMGNVPHVFSKRGYWLNPSSGVTQPLPYTNKIQYHYYPPHLRDTPVNPSADHILVLGDSFTFGWLLPWNHTFIYQLQKDLDRFFGKNKFQLLNAGVGGWGTADYLSYLEQYGTKTSPKYVIIFLNTDDIGRAIKRNIYTLANPRSMELTYNFQQPPKETLKEKLYGSWLFNHSVFIHFMHYCIHLLLLKNELKVRPFSHQFPESSSLDFHNKFAIQYGEALFLQVNQWCVTHHAKLLVVTTGFNAFYPQDLHDPTKAFLTAAPAFFKKEHIPFYDSASTFKKLTAGKKFQIPGDQHPNKIGASAIAAASWPWIKNQIQK